jgi:trimeric autotransporter adhesin
MKTSNPRILLCVIAFGCFAISQLPAQNTNTNYGYSAGQLNPGQNNSAFGFQALAFFVSGDQNTAIGSRALSGSFDSNAEPNSTGTENTAIGAQALSSDRAGSYNTATGKQALASNQDGNYNVADGWQALFSNTSGKENTALGTAALLYNQTGSYNTAAGRYALANNKASENTAVGYYAMVNSRTGIQNAALGTAAMYANVTGNSNTATGWGALDSNRDGSYNTATGAESLWSNTAEFNSAHGTRSLYTNSTGAGNTASGYAAMYQNTTGNYNTAAGDGALYYNSSGSNNVAVGTNAGANLTNGSNNIVIGANVLGKGGEAKKIRIGTQGTQNGTFIAGIYNISEPTANGIKPVYVNSSGQLGTTPPASSARFKEAIRPMDKTSEAILGLKPVTFRYKNDEEASPQFGLIAEEVAKIDPDLVIRDDEGKIYTVRYDAVNAMLLNEFLKEHQKVESLQATVANLVATVTEQAEQIQRVNDKLERTKVSSSVAQQ